MLYDSDALGYKVFLIILHHFYRIYMGDFSIWQKAFEDCGLDINVAAQRLFNTDQILPWQHLGGPDKDYLLKHLGPATKLIGR